MAAARGATPSLSRIQVRGVRREPQPEIGNVFVDRVKLPLHVGQRGLLRQDDSRYAVGIEHFVGIEEYTFASRLAANSALAAQTCSARA